MDTTAGRLAERPGDPAVRPELSVRAWGGALVGVGEQVHGVDERWSPAGPGSGEPGYVLSRLPGRSPAQPLGSPLATGSSVRTRRLRDRDPVGGTGRGPGIRSTRGST